MKKTRFLSFFLICLLCASLLCPAALAETAETAESAEAAEAAETAESAEAAETAEIVSVAPEDPAIRLRKDENGADNGAVLLVDLNTGKQIYGRNEHQHLYPASLTKIMTTLLALEAVEEGRLSLDDMIIASDIVLTLPPGSSTDGIKTGETMSLRSLLYCLMVASANEAADILAETVSGSVSRFVDAMNQKAASLGCKDTHFVNPHGFHDPDHYTSAWDMFLITREAMRFPAFMTLCDARSYTVPATNLRPEHVIHTTNGLLDNWRYGNAFLNPEAHGVKTGSTDQAGHCLVSTAKRGDLHLLSVIMGTENVKREDGTTDRLSFSETTRLFNWGFANFHYETIIEENEAVTEAPVALSRTDHVVAVAASDIRALLPAKLDPSMLERVATLEEEIPEAPVEAGQTLGTVELRYDGVSYGTVELKASYGAERSRLMAAQKAVLDFVHQPAVWAVAGAAALAAAALALRSFFVRRRSSNDWSGYRGGRR